MPSQTARLHQLNVSGDILATTSLYPNAFFWTSSLNQSLFSHILVFSYDFLDANSCLSLISKPICLTTLSTAREPTCRCGLINAISYQHSDGAMHFYTLDIITPDWQLTQSIHTRSFTHQSTFDIISAILSDYNFDWQVSEQLLSSEQLTAPLSIRTQSDVSDYDFITGLLADIGVTTYWVDGDSVDKLGYWSLVSALDENKLSPLDYHYEKSSVQSGQDSVDTLQMSAKQLGSRTVMVRADGLAADTIYEGVADDDSPLAFDDTAVLLGAPSRVHSDASATRLAEQWLRANGCHREYYTATGAMRGLYIGSQVSINSLPSIGRLSTYCTSMTIVGIEPNSDSVSYHNQTLIKDWLMRSVQRATQTALSAIPEHGYDIARDTGIWVTATLLDSAIPYCPYPSLQSFVSSTYTGVTQARTGDQTTSATPSYASQVTDDGLQRTITTPVSAGISPHDDGVTPPLRSLQLSSGTTHGWQFTPRLGQSVLLNHWYGDKDSPLISRSLYDGIGMGDTDNKDITNRDEGLANRHNLQNGSSPRWHGGGMEHSQIKDDDAHSGWLTGIAQYGLNDQSEVSLLFDDSPSKIGMQWSVNTNAHANAQHPTTTNKAVFAPDEHILELGVLRHRYSNHQSTISGHGVNLATDHGLQAAADSGVLLSTFGIRHSQSEHESAWVNDAGQRQLKLGTELSETLAEAKQAHLQSTKAMKTANQSIEAFKTAAQVMDDTLQTEVLGAPDVLVVSKDSILASSNNTLTTAKTIVRQSGATQSDVVAGNYTLTADTIESLSGIAGQAALSGLHISANTKPLAIQAQGGELQLHSQQSMTIGSESGQVNIASPKRIKLQTSAGASLTIDESGIKLVCPGEIKIKAVKKALVSGARANYSVPMMPETVPLFSNKLDVYDLFYHRDFSEVDYVAMMDDGQIVEGTLDAHGRTDRLMSMESKGAEVLVGYLDNWSIEIDTEEEESEAVENVEFEYSDEECACLAPEEDIDFLEDEK
ncbi:contractile injection system protein, VgrG/Pvc8 family [uncultured Psychrobacter sp.]|uniref:contractile injection system protein, VgrG/Pvc8 family n=1 Tax=uncultured Psychrobacter sp. TaxID=259303 RepID=UPI002630C477|nr:contractile injection system protein, VgrG/Pvc8 family [uncultured Psychrobacter sp.]